MAEQGLFSTAHFLINIVWARALPEHEYGAFVAMFAIYVLLSAAHTAFFGVPLLVFTQSRFGDHVRSYSAAVLKLQVLLGAGGALVLIATGLVLGAGEGQSHSGAVLGLGIAVLPMLFVQLLRRLCYSLFRPLFAALGGIIYLGVSLAALLIADAHGWHSALVGYLVLTLAAILACTVMAVGIKGMKDVQPGSVSMRSVARAHWTFGRFSATSSALAWIAVNSYYLLLPYLAAPQIGLADAGALRAQMTLLMPLLQLHGALAAMLLPSIVQQRSAGQALSPRRFIATFVLVDCCYCTLLAVLAEPALHLAYSGKYDQFAPILQMLCLYPLFSGVGQVFSARILAREQPRSLLLPGALSAVASIAIAILTYPHWGLGGIACAMIVGALVQTVGMALRSRNLT